MILAGKHAKIACRSKLLQRMGKTVAGDDCGDGVDLGEEADLIDKRLI